MKRIATFALFSLISAVCHGQMAAQYQAAAQVWFTQAAKCQNPIGAACMRANGQYNQCLAAQLGPGGPSSCTQPTCSTACTTSGGTAGTAAGATSNNNVNNLVQLGVGIIGLFHKDNPQPDSQPEADSGPTPEEIAANEAAAEAARQQQINSDAANILQEANSLVAANNPPGETPSPSPSNSTSAVSALLGDDTPAPDASAAVSALLDDSTDANAATNNAVAGLLDKNTVTDSASAFPAGDPALTPDPAPTGADTAQEFSAVVPQDPSMAEAMQSTPPSPPADVAALSSDVDTPNPSPSLIDQLQDGLQGAISSVKQGIASAQATLGSLMNTPTAQIMSATYGASQGTVPAPSASDTPEQMDQKVNAQAVVGFSNFIGTAPEKGLYNYWNGNNNQVMGELGYATGTPDNNGSH